MVAFTVLIVGNLLQQVISSFEAKCSIRLGASSASVTRPLLRKCAFFACYFPAFCPKAGKASVDVWDITNKLEVSEVGF